MKNVRRRPTGRAVGVLMLALVLIAAGCGSSNNKSSDSGGDTSGKRIDSLLVFGGPPECQERPLCLGETEQTALRPQVQGSQEARRRVAPSP